MLASIEASGEEGPERFEDLTERLRVARNCQWSRETSLHPLLWRNPSGQKFLDAPEGGRREEGGERRDRRKGDRRDDGTRPSAVADANIRVGVGLLDKLMDLVGELVLTRNQILQFNTEREDAALNATSQRLNLITTELQEGVMKTRMQPIGMVWNKLPRVVRDMAVALGKQIRLEMDGAGDGTRPDHHRSHQGSAGAPGPQLLRPRHRSAGSPRARGQAAAGRLTLRAYHEGGQVNIEIADDGAGIDVARVKQKAIEKGLLRPEQAEKLSDREALNLIFQPGFSTAQTVTNVSGRGVGMDVVKSTSRRSAAWSISSAGRAKAPRSRSRSPHAGHHSGPGDHQRGRTLRDSSGQPAGTDPAGGRFARKSTSSMCMERRCIAGAAVCCRSPI